jgi:hypothetical protein
MVFTSISGHVTRPTWSVSERGRLRYIEDFADTGQHGTFFTKKFGYASLSQQRFFEVFLSFTLNDSILAERSQHASQLLLTIECHRTMSARALIYFLRSICPWTTA